MAKLADAVDSKSTDTQISYEFDSHFWDNFMEGYKGNWHPSDLENPYTR